MADYGIYDDFDDNYDDNQGGNIYGEDPYGQNEQVHHQIEQKVNPISDHSSDMNSTAKLLPDDHPQTPEVVMIDGDKTRRVKKRRYKPDDERRSANGRKEARKMGDCCKVYKQSVVSITVWIIIYAVWLLYAQP